MPMMSLGEPIAGTSNLFAWGEDQLIKLYGGEAPAGWVEHMARIDRVLYEAGVPVPASGEIVEIGSSLGLVYERIGGNSMADSLLRSQDADAAAGVQLARTFAEVHAEIHACGRIPELPSQRPFMQTVIRRADVLPADLMEAALRALDGMPEGDQLCHGDFHPYNVLMSPRGPVVIDWNNAQIGNPLEDVAMTTLILSGVSVSQPPYQALIAQFNQAYLERYFQLRPGDQQELAAWQPIVAALRLCDGIPELDEWLLEQVRTGLAQLGQAPS